MVSATCLKQTEFKNSILISISELKLKIVTIYRYKIFLGYMGARHKRMREYKARVDEQ